MFYNGELETQGAIFDYAQLGGAIGTIKLGVIIPNNSILVRAVTMALVAPVSTAGCTISFDTITNGVNPPVQSVGNIIPALAYTSYALNVPVGTALTGVDYNAAPIKFTTEAQITMSIGARALTAGKIILAVSYYKFNT